jgi:hypothetical protein
MPKSGGKLYPVRVPGVFFDEIVPGRVPKSTRSHHCCTNSSGTAIRQQIKVSTGRNARKKLKDSKENDDNENMWPSRYFFMQCENAKTQKY